MLQSLNFKEKDGTVKEGPYMCLLCQEFTDTEHWKVMMHVDYKCCQGLLVKREGLAGACSVEE